MRTLFTRMSCGISPLRIERGGRVYCFVGRVEEVDRWERVGDGVYHVGRGDMRCLEVDGNIAIRGGGKLKLRGRGRVEIIGGVSVEIESGDIEVIRK